MVRVRNFEESVLPLTIQVKPLEWGKGRVGSPLPDSTCAQHRAYSDLHRQSLHELFRRNCPISVPVKTLGDLADAYGGEVPHLFDGGMLPAGAIRQEGTGRFVRVTVRAWESIVGGCVTYGASHEPHYPQLDSPDGSHTSSCQKRTSLWEQIR